MACENRPKQEKKKEGKTVRKKGRKKGKKREKKERKKKKSLRTLARFNHSILIWKLGGGELGSLEFLPRTSNLKVISFTLKVGISCYWCN